MCGGSPLILFFYFIQECERHYLLSGRLHRRGGLISTLVLPSLNRSYLVYVFVLVISDVGEIHRRGVIIVYSRSPLCRFCCRCIVLQLISCRGDYTGRSIKTSTLVLPSMNQNSCVLMTPILTPIFDAFYGHHFSHGLSARWWYTQWLGPYYMYIYSLRAFLTTKGALIDGD